MTHVNSMISLLQSYKFASGVFNPWSDNDPECDVKDAARLRSDNLRDYLKQRITSAKYLVIAEALGYQGGRFSGIAMTSERMIMGNHKQIRHDMIISGTKRSRTSNIREDMQKTVRLKGMAEPTATMVWNTLLSCDLKPLEFVLWNAFPFHPYHENETTKLNNRTGTKLNEKELKVAKECLSKFLELFPSCPIISIGDISVATLKEINVMPVCEATHPANGGKPKFVKNIKTYLKSTNKMSSSAPL